MWTIKRPSAPEQVAEIANKYNITETMAQILIHKGINKIDDFLKETPLHNAWCLKNMDKCVKRICDAITRGEHIRIFGDMDVDGITATAICVVGLRDAGAVVSYDIPHRVNDGYGANVRMIKQALEDGVNLIVTVDNGIAQTEAVSYAKEHNLDIIITDHHEVPFIDENNEKRYILPDTEYIIDQKQPDDIYPFRDICGAMIAYKVVSCVQETLQINKTDRKNLIELCALGTVCDIMPLVDENRTIVKRGLEALKNTTFPGLKKLMEVTEINPETISAYHVGFIIGPCLNATGRLSTAKLGVELLLSDNEEKITSIAEECKKLNDERKNMTVKGEEETLKQIKAKGISKVIVLYIPKCSPAVAGIVAGRIKETFNHPTIILGDDPADSTMLRGSGRSISGYNMFEEISRHKGLLEKFGGHEMAAGLSIKKENFVMFGELLNGHCTLTDKDFEKRVRVDIKLPLHLITERLIDELLTLEPYGEGNPKPVIAESQVSVRKGFLMGQDKNMIRLKLEGSLGQIFTAVYFGDASEMRKYYSEKYGEQEWENMMDGFDNTIKMTFSYEPQINEWKGNRSIQVVIRDYC